DAQAYRRDQAVIGNAQAVDAQMGERLHARLHARLLVRMKVHDQTQGLAHEYRQRLPAKVRPLRPRRDDEVIGDGELEYVVAVLHQLAVEQRAWMVELPLQFGAFDFDGAINQRLQAGVVRVTGFQLQRHRYAGVPAEFIEAGCE